MYQVEYLEASVVCVTLEEDSFSPQRFVQIFSEVVKAPNYRESAKLWDFRFTVFPEDLQYFHLLELAEERNRIYKDQIPAGKLALVVPPGKGEDLSTMYEALNADGEQEIRTFTDKEAALEWLMGAKV